MKLWGLGTGEEHFNLEEGMCLLRGFNYFRIQKEDVFIVYS
jgi:hypothetical protein